MINENIGITDFKVYATLIWYYFICKRQVWYMAHNIVPDQDNPYIQIGKIISENYYKKEKKEVVIDNMIIDLIMNSQNTLIIGEIKKSSKNIESCTMQLCFYLKKLNEWGIKAQGIMLFPKENKKIKIELTQEIIKKIEETEKEIIKIINQKLPPIKQRIPFCKNCGYKDLCWS